MRPSIFKGFLPHTPSPEEHPLALVASKTCENVEPFPHMELVTTAMRTGKPDRGVQSGQLLPPKKAVPIVALSRNLSVQGGHSEDRVRIGLSSCTRLFTLVYDDPIRGVLWVGRGFSRGGSFGLRLLALLLASYSGVLAVSTLCWRQQ